MIGKISGVLDYRALDHVLVDVRGVGYVVYVSDRTMASLPGPGAAVSLYTELVVREDLLQLYGFTTLREKEWHRLLVSVQGVGAKAALAILGTLGVDATARAITIGDWAAIKAAPGVGPKIAQRVVLELKNKAPAVMALGGMGQAAAPEVDVIDAGDLDAPRATPRPTTSKPTKPIPSAAAAQAEALSALQNLGYAPQDAAAAVVTAIDAAPELGDSTANLIRAALKLLAPKN